MDNNKEMDEKFEKALKTSDRTEGFDEKDIADNKWMCVLAYLGILVLIPIFTRKESKVTRFHCNQGLVLAIVEIIVFTVLSILTAIPVIRWIAYIVEAVLSAAFLGLVIYEIVNIFQGQVKALPVIDKFKILK